MTTSIAGGLYLNASGVYRVPRPAEIQVAGGWTIQVVPTSDFVGSVTLSRNSTAQVGDTLIASLVTPTPFYYANTQAVAPLGMPITTNSTWLVPFFGYELYVVVSYTNPAGAVQINVAPIAPRASTLPTVTLAQIDLKQGIPLNYPEDLAFQFQLAADNQQSSVSQAATLTTV